MTDPQALTEDLVELGVDEHPVLPGLAPVFADNMVFEVADALLGRELSADHGDQAGGVGTGQHRRGVRECLAPTQCQAEHTH
jgi:hypothetical protein